MEKNDVGKRKQSTAGPRDPNEESNEPQPSPTVYTQLKVDQHAYLRSVFPDFLNMDERTQTLMLDACCFAAENGQSLTGQEPETGLGSAAPTISMSSVSSQHLSESSRSSWIGEQPMIDKEGVVSMATTANMELSGDPSVFIATALDSDTDGATEEDYDDELLQELMEEMEERADTTDIQAYYSWLDLSTLGRMNQDQVSTPSKTYATSLQSSQSATVPSAVLDSTSFPNTEKIVEAPSGFTSFLGSSQGIIGLQKSLHYDSNTSMPIAGPSSPRRRQTIGPGRSRYASSASSNAPLVKRRRTMSESNDSTAIINSPDRGTSARGLSAQRGFHS